MRMLWLKFSDGFDGVMAIHGVESPADVDKEFSMVEFLGAAS